MLVFTRRTNEEIVIQGNIRVCILDVNSGRARIGIDAPASVRVDRSEVHTKRQNTPDSEDLELRRRVMNYLCSLNRRGFDELEITVDGGNVLICGAVKSYHLKQLAARGCQRVAGVLMVQDHIQVEDTSCAKR